MPLLPSYRVHTGLPSQPACSSCLDPLVCPTASPPTLAPQSSLVGTFPPFLCRPRNKCIKIHPLMRRIMPLLQQSAAATRMPARAVAKSPHSGHTSPTAPAHPNTHCQFPLIFFAHPRSSTDIASALPLSPCRPSCTTPSLFPNCFVHSRAEPTHPFSTRPESLSGSFLVHGCLRGFNNNQNDRPQVVRANPKWISRAGAL